MVEPRACESDQRSRSIAAKRPPSVVGRSRSARRSRVGGRGEQRLELGAVDRVEAILVHEPLPDRSEHAVDERPAFDGVEPRVRRADALGAEPVNRERPQGARRLASMSDVPPWAASVGGSAGAGIVHALDRGGAMNRVAPGRQLRQRQIPLADRRDQRTRREIAFAVAPRIREHDFAGAPEPFRRERARALQRRCGRGVRNARGALQAHGDERIQVRRRRPRFVRETDDPQMIERHPGGLDQAEHLHRHLGRLRLEERLGGHAPEPGERRVEAELVQHPVEAREPGDDLVPLLQRLVLGGVEHALAGKAEQRERLAERAGPVAGGARANRRCFRNSA